MCKHILRRGLDTEMGIENEELEGGCTNEVENLDYGKDNDLDVGEIDHNVEVDIK